MSDTAPAAPAAETTTIGIDYDQTATAPQETATAPASQTSQETQSQSDEGNAPAQAVSNEANNSKEQSGEQSDEQKEAVAGVMDAYADKTTEAPIQYEFKNTDGTVISNETTALISDLAKDLNLTQEAAQKLYERGSGDDGIIAKINQNAIAHYNKEWGRAIESDPELGGSNLQDTKFNVAKAMTLDSSGELRQFFKDSGLGNFPPLVKFLNKVGAQLHSDRNFITGKPAASEQKADPLAAMYKSMK